MSKSQKPFKTVEELCNLIDAYFKYIEGEHTFEKKTGKKTEEEPVMQKVTAREAEPATVAGMALFIGFNSREELDEMEKKGKYSSTLKRARLRVEAAYEKKLHQQSSSGAIFALKSLGWNEKPDTEKHSTVKKKFIIKVVETGPKPVSDEKEVSF